MNQQLINYSQTYLSTILSLNILLVTASSFLLYRSATKFRNLNFLLFFSVLVSVLAICFVVYSYKELFDFILGYNPNAISNFKAPFKILDWVFRLNIFSLILTGLYIFCFMLRAKK